MANVTEFSSDSLTSQVDYDTFLNTVIDDGIEAATKDYADDAAMLRGAIDGFEACRRKTLPQIEYLRQEAMTNVSNCFKADADRDTYWRANCRMLEIEWVHNVVSAAFGLTCTYRGMLKAAEILNGRSI